jgi:hypothetical protein
MIPVRTSNGVASATASAYAGRGSVPGEVLSV